VYGVLSLAAGGARGPGEEFEGGLRGGQEPKRILLSAERRKIHPNPTLV
jgi:hypothetical protein